MPLAAETHGRQSSLKDIQHAHSTLKTQVAQNRLLRFRHS